MSGSNRKPSTTAATDAKDVKVTPAPGAATANVNTDGKAGTPISYALYILPKVDPSKAPPAALENAAVLCPEDKESYSVYFVRKGQWDTDKKGIKKLEKQKLELEGIIAEGLLPKTKKNDKALNAALALGKISTFASLPPDLLTDSIRSFLKTKDATQLPKVSQSIHGIFKSTLDTEKFTHTVAYGLRDEAEAMLKKAQAADAKRIDPTTEPSELLRLLRAKNPVTDSSGRSFTEPGLTAFQYAYWARNFQMLLMLGEYMPKEEQASQIRDLRDNTVKYSLVLMSAAPDEELILGNLHSLYCQNQNKPILIKQNDTLQLYGYDFATSIWKLTAIKNTKPFKDLPFPQRDFSAVYSLRVCPTAPTVENIQNLVPGNNSAYVLVQAQAGRPPSGLYYVDRSGALPMITELSSHFPPGYSIKGLTRYFSRNNQPYNIDRLQVDQLQAITTFTNHPLEVVDKKTLTTDMYEALAEGHTQGTEHGVHYTKETHYGLIVQFVTELTKELLSLAPSTEPKESAANAVSPLPKQQL